MDTECPHCHSSLMGEPIPQRLIDAGYYPRGDTNYSRTIGVEIRGVYDGVLYWQCPDCGGKWHRWPEGHPYRAQAERYVTS